MPSATSASSRPRVSRSSLKKRVSTRCKWPAKWRCASSAALRRLRANPSAAMSHGASASSLKTARCPFNTPGFSATKRARMESRRSCRRKRKSSSGYTAATMPVPAFKKSSNRWRLREYPHPPERASGRRVFSSICSATSVTSAMPCCRKAMWWTASQRKPAKTTVKSRSIM